MYNVNIPGPFKALDRIDIAIKDTEAALQSQVKSLTDVTTIPNSDRAVLQAEFDSGLKIKLIVSATEDDSFEFVQRCRQLPPGVRVPGIVVEGKGWVAFEWIEGPTLSEHGPSDDLVLQAAQMLSRIHAVKVAGRPELVMKSVQQKLEEKLPLLVTHQIISPKSHDDIRKIGQAFANTNFQVSLIHGDFSPHNLVVSSTGLCSIDNENLAEHVPEYDLCRAANFWDEWNSSGADLFDAYSQNANRTVATQSIFFWSVFDLVYRISYQLSRSKPNNFCIDRLRLMLGAGAFE